MEKPRVQFSIKTCPSDDAQALEDLLNQMANLGWELYSMHEGENDSGFFFNCIFVKEVEYKELQNADEAELVSFRTRVEKLMKSDTEPYEIAKNIQQKIKEKRERIAKIKSKIDETSENQRQKLNDEISKHLDELTDLKKQLKEAVSPDKFVEFLGVKTLSIHLSEELLPLVNQESQSNLVLETVRLRQHLADELGYIIPHISIEDDETLSMNEFSLEVRGIDAFRGVVYPGFLMFFQSELDLNKYPKNSLKDVDAITGLPVVWIEKEKTKDFWCKGLDASEVVSRAVEWAVIRHVEDIFDYNDVNRYVDVVAKENLFLIENIIPDYISVANVKYVLSNLIKERISIKDIVYIFEKLNDFAQEQNKEDLLERIRTSLARQISKTLANDNAVIQIFELSQQTEDYFIKKVSGKSSTIKISLERVKKIIDNIRLTIETLDNPPKEIIITVPSSIRQLVHTILSSQILNLRVIAQTELSAGQNVEVLGNL